MTHMLIELCIQNLQRFIVEVSVIYILINKRMQHAMAQYVSKLFLDQFVVSWCVLYFARCRFLYNCFELQLYLI